MKNQKVIYVYNGVLFRFKKEGNSDTSYNMDEPQNVQVAKGQIFCDTLL